MKILGHKISDKRMFQWEPTLLTFKSFEKNPPPLLEPLARSLVDPDSPFLPFLNSSIVDERGNWGETEGTEVFRGEGGVLGVASVGKRFAPLLLSFWLAMSLILLLLFLLMKERKREGEREREESESNKIESHYHGLGGGVLAPEAVLILTMKKY